jgi:nucleotide-binding universal stress UspA family protein
MAVLTAKTKVAVRNIVFITDFSRESEMARAYAAAIARHHDSKIYLVHPLQPPAPRAVSPGEPAPSLESEASAEEKLKAEAEKCTDIESARWVLKGTALEVVNRILSFEMADLVIVGTHGARGFRKAAAGTAAEHFFRHVQCPVLAVGPAARPCRPQWEPRHVLLATDLQSSEAAAARCAVFLAREHEARLVLLHVAAPAVMPFPEDQESSARPYFQSRLREILSYKPQLEYPAEFRVEFGEDAVAEILRVATEAQSDLIVLSVHRRDPWGFHVVHEAYRIVAEAPCPVLITQRSDGDRPR